MTTKLISITAAKIDGQELTPEELIVYVARVSNPSNQLNMGTADKLLGYMILNKHWSPFDMVNMTIEVTTSRAIAHQILRHWSIKPQEFSQRYAEATSYEPIQLRLAARSNRQSSTKLIGTAYFKEGFTDGTDVEVANEQDYEVADLAVLGMVADHLKACDALYKTLIERGIAKECARMVLPLTTSTTMYLNGSVRSWIHYLEQRTDAHAQLEHRQVAMKINEIFEANFPNISKALGK